MAKTRAQIRDRVLRKLGKLSIGQTAEAEIADDIEDAYDQVYASLEADGLVTWLSSSVPDEFVEDVVNLVAMERSESIPNDRYQRIALAATSAKLNISAKIAGKWVNPREVLNY